MTVTDPAQSGLFKAIVPQQSRPRYGGGCGSLMPRTQKRQGGRSHELRNDLPGEESNHPLSGSSAPMKKEDASTSQKQGEKNAAF